MAGNLKSIEVSQETMSRLQLSARESQRDENELLEEAVVQYLDRQEMELAAVEVAIASAADESLISHDAMRAWLKSWGGEHELPPPEPDLAR
jgi:predicted transcriptional regulator